MVSAYGRIAAKRLVYAYLGTCMPCPCAEILDKGLGCQQATGKKEVIEDAPRPRRIFHCNPTVRVFLKLLTKLYAMAHI